MNITPDAAAQQCANLLKLASNIFNLPEVEDYDLYITDPRIDRESGQLSVDININVRENNPNADKLLFAHPDTVICGIYGYLREVHVQTYWGMIHVKYTKPLQKDEIALLTSLGILHSSRSYSFSTISCSI